MYNPLKLKYAGMYCNMAQAAEQQTDAVRERVGCVIVTPNGIVIPGYNGQPSGHHTNCCENTEVEEHNLSGLLTYRMKTDRSVLHAENNALGKALRAGVSIDGADLYVTVAPCDVCARQIIPSGIKRVFYDRKHDDMTGLETMASAGIEVVQWHKLGFMKEG